MARGWRETAIKGWGRLSAHLEATGDLERLVAWRRGDRLVKWRHYYPIYERHFARFRGRDFTLLEIGVANGGSLALWRDYFGPAARIVGVDVEADCKQYETPGTRVVIGSQGDPAFLQRLAAEHGPFDIVIDDGSHAFDHQRVTFEELYRHITPEGLYVCEDLCTSYWPEEFGGGVRQAGTFMEYLKDQVDELNAWFWRDGVEAEADTGARTLHGIHFYAALAIIEKARIEPPVMAHVGSRRRKPIHRHPGP